MMETWSKYTFVCDPDECDTLAEYTVKDTYGWPNGVIKVTCPCGRNMQYLSVDNATILPITEQKEEAMETTTPAPQVMTLDWVENDVTTTKTYTESDIRHIVWQNKNFLNKQNEWYTNTNKLRTLLEEVFVDSEDQESLEQIADIFDIPLTKEVEYTAWVRVDMTIEVDLTSDLDNIEELISQNLTIDSYGSEISVNNHEVDRVEEGAY
jgi:hypothetical protein